MVTNMELSEAGHGIMGTCCTALGWRKDILGRNTMRWTWDCLDIQQLTGMSQDVMGMSGYTKVNCDVLGYPLISMLRLYTYC